MFLRLLVLPRQAGVSVVGINARNKGSNSIRVKPLNVASKALLLQARSIFSSSNGDDDRQNARVQRQLLKELFNSGNYKQVIARFEQQPQLASTSSRYSAEEKRQHALSLQADPIMLETYIAAMILDGRSNQVVQRISPLIRGGSPSSLSSSSNANFASNSSSSSSFSNSFKESDPIPYNMQTNPQQWQNQLDRNFPNSSHSTLNGGLPLGGSGGGGNYSGNGGGDESIRVVISEAFSWTKYGRKFLTTIFYGVLLMTGLSVVLDQQGMMKNGIGNGEVQPLTSNTKVTFEDVQGVDEAKHELEEVVEFLKEPGKFMSLGGKLPKGILLYGPPGTGKTHLARAVAGEAGVPFFQMSGSEFDELYVGVGARRVRELFAAAKKRAPCIIFIDELDAVGSKRSMKDQSYMRQTLNQLLVEMDGFAPSSGVILIAATNTPDSLDKALMRPGRFDRLVPVPLPDVKGRNQILRVHMRGVQFGKDVLPELIARGTPGFSGADLANLVNQAAIKASKDSSKFVTMANLEWAKDKIIMGAERKSAVITPEDKKMTAYHEGGHTLVALFTKGATPLHKVTVIPRGNALGVTVMLPEGDKSNDTKQELIARLDVAMGGRVAEELIYGPQSVTTGAYSDLQNATRTARAMVLSYGMSDKIGLISWSDDDYAKASPATKAEIEQEVKLMLETSYARVTTLLKSKDRELHLLAAALIDQETLDVKEVQKVIGYKLLNQK